MSTLNQLAVSATQTDFLSFAISQIAVRRSDWFGTCLSLDPVAFQGLSADRLHVLALLEDTQFPPKQAVELAARSAWARVAEAAELPQTATANLFRKLEFPIWDADDYTALKSVLNCPSGIKVLRHSRVITRNLVRLLGCLPTSLRAKHILPLVSSLEEAEFLRLLDSWARKVRGECLAASEIRTREVLWETAREVFRSLDFTLPIFNGGHHPQITWITSTQQLLEVGDEMENCLHSMCEEALKGSDAFFLWEGNERVVVHVRAGIDGVARLEHAEAHNCSEPSSESMREIEAACSAIGIKLKRGTFTAAWSAAEEFLGCVAFEAMSIDEEPKDAFLASMRSWIDETSVPGRVEHVAASERRTLEPSSRITEKSSQTIGREG